MTVTPPVKVLLGACSASVPAPVLVMPKAPVTGPSRDKVLAATLTVVFAGRAMVP